MSHLTAAGSIEQIRLPKQVVVTAVVVAVCRSCELWLAFPGPPGGRAAARSRTKKWPPLQLSCGTSSLCVQRAQPRPFALPRRPAAPPLRRRPAAPPCRAALPRRPAAPPCRAALPGFQTWSAQVFFSFYRSATNPLHVVICCFKCAHVATSCHILCQYFSMTADYGESRHLCDDATTPFVLTPSGSRQLPHRRAAPPRRAAQLPTAARLFRFCLS